MPYKLKQNKDDSVQLINKDTGHILAYHTTPERAMKQIKAIHTKKGMVKGTGKKHTKNSMPVNHRIRKNVELLQHRIIRNPKHHKFIDMTKKLLKHEEMHGSGFWDDVWDVTKDVLAFPRDIIENIPFVKPALEMGLTAVAGPEAPMLLELGLAGSHMIYGDNTNKGLRETWNPSQSTTNEDYDDGYSGVRTYISNARASNASMPRAESNAATSNVYQQSIGQVVDETVQDIADDSEPRQNLAPNAREQILDPFGGKPPPLYNPLEHLIASSNLAFPPTMHFDPREQPLSLVKFIESQSMAGLKVSDAQYDAIHRTTKPELWLSFPQNGYFKKYPTSQSSIN